MLTRVFNEEDAQLNKKLPKELLLRIFSYLDVVSLCRCAQVSKAWNDLALDGSNWQRINLFEFQTDVEGPVIENISKRCGGFLRKLSLRGCQSVADGSMKTLARSCPNIEDLNLNGCKMITDATCQVLSIHCKKLYRLDLYSCTAITDLSLKALADGPHNLAHINISWCDQITEKGVEALARGCPKLRTFLSKGCTQITDAAVACLAQFCPNLEVVNLHGCAHVEDTGVAKLAEECTQLRNLCLSGCKNLTDASLIALAQHCHQLSTLEVAGCNLFTDTGFQALSRSRDTCLAGFLLITKLCNPGVWNTLRFRKILIDDFGLQSCRLLEKMDLEECSLITDQTLINLAMGCPRLENLSLSHCELVTDDGIRHLGTSPCAAEHLTVLELDNCPLITDTSLEHLITCHNLQRPVEFTLSAYYASSDGKRDEDLETASTTSVEVINESDLTDADGEVGDIFKAEGGLQGVAEIGRPSPVENDRPGEDGNTPSTSPPRPESNGSPRVPATAGSLTHYLHGFIFGGSGGPSLEVVDDCKRDSVNELSIQVDQPELTVGSFRFLDQSQFLEGDWNRNRLYNLHSCQFQVDGNNFYIRKLGKNYLLAIDGQHYLAKVNIGSVKANLTHSDLWREILSAVSVIQVLEDKLADERAESLNEFRKALEANDRCGDPVHYSATLLFFKSIRTRRPQEILSALKNEKFVPANVRDAAGQLLEKETSLHKRKVVNFFAGAPSFLNLVEIIDTMYEQGSKRHKELLLQHCPRTLVSLINGIESMPPEKFLCIAKADIDVFYHLLTIADDSKIRQYFDHLAEKFLAEVKKCNYEHLFKGTNPSVNPVLSYLFASFNETMNEIGRICDNFSAKDILIRKSNNDWRLVDIIPWPLAGNQGTDRDHHSYRLLECQLRFLFKLMNHFWTKGLVKKTRFEYTLEPSTKQWCRKIRWNSKMIASSVWLYLLDQAVMQVVVDKILTFDEFCNRYGPLMSSHWIFVTRATTENHESFRVVTQNVAKYIVQTSQFLLQGGATSNETSREILNEQMASLAITIGNMADSEVPFDSFRDLISEYIKFWDLHITFVAQHEKPSKYLADQLSDLYECILQMISTALKREPVPGLVAFLRSTNEFLSDYQNMDFSSTWYVKRVDKHKNCVLGLEKISNKIANEANCSYLVKNIDQYLGSIATTDRPPHYNIRIVRELITCVKLALERDWASAELPAAGQLAAGTTLLGAIRKSLVYLREQPGYRDFAKYESESIEPFLRAVNNCQELEAFTKRIETVSESLWYLRKLDEIGLDKALSLMEPIFSGNINKRLLEQSYNNYRAKFQGYVGKCGSSAAEKINAIVRDLEGHRKTVKLENWDATFKTLTLPDILAGLSAIWSLMISEDVTTGKKLIQPHCIQILCILRLMSVDQNSPGVSNHLAEILTGQGKSVVLALTAALFAFTGYNAFIICYSRYLVKRDESDFQQFFNISKIASKVQYITVQELAEKCMNPIIDGNSLSLRGCLQDHILQHRPLPNLSSASFNFKNTILLIDEVDVFFSRNIFGSVKQPALKLYIDGLGDMQEFIWKKVTSGCSSTDVLLERLNEFIEAKVQAKDTAFVEFNYLLNRTGSFQVLEVQGGKLVAKKYHSNREFLQNQLKEMTEAAIEVKKCDTKSYVINPRGMISQRNPIDGTLSAEYVSYQAIFYYFKLKGVDFDDMHGQNYSYIPIKAGHISYAKLPAEFLRILGVSGTLRNVYKHEKQAMLDFYKIVNFTASPSFFGTSNLKFCLMDNVHILRQADLSWERKLFEHANAQIRSGRSVIMFFKSLTELMSFKYDYGNKFAALNILTEDTTDKKQIIDQSGVPFMLTLATSQMGRGVDFKSSLVTEKKRRRTHNPNVLSGRRERGDAIQRKNRTSG
ncbi:unnamed protein product [Nesidiocoris tenuis]|uniref:F-box domain-containing protein n=1 Tax=Nesidiocoris tenuis TaxID=355587 RepID=A0A6H5H0H2_9HEMI|nr:unnamed protein product [Nesidiocoris tenuis]